ncbi:MAG: OmpW family outer-rane protein [Rickettsiaceae bacterium]|jgi:outer membrane protein|nr:OmpW family outer-rane protein [Rickettsiaceae bacterium]
MKKYLSIVLITSLVGYALPGFSIAPEEDFYSYEDEGRLIVKLRGQGIITDGKQKGLPSPTSARGIASPKANNKLTSKGIGLEGATTLFFNDNLASELSLGFAGVRTKAPENIAHNYSDNLKAGKQRNIYFLPISMLIQYHIAPFGAISPYIGGGLHYSMLFTRSSDYKLNNSKGPVLQAGIDFITRDDTILNVDVKKYIMQSKVKYKSTVSANGIHSKLNIDPVIISVGIGYKF